METIFDFINQNVNQFFNGELFFNHKIECKRVFKNVINSGPHIVPFQLIMVNFSIPLRNFL